MFVVEVEVVLLQVGYYVEEVVVVVCRLVMFGGEDESILCIEFSVCLKVCVCLGEYVGMVVGMMFVILCSSVEEVVYQQLFFLFFGSWFDIDIGDGILCCQCLFWYSLLIGYVLLVNLCGQKIVDIDLDMLVWQISVGQVQLVIEDKVWLVDCVWEVSFGVLCVLVVGYIQEIFV